MFMATHLIGFGAGGSVVTLSFTDSSVDASNLTTYTFSTQALGTAASDRRIVVGAGSSSAAGTTVSSVTVGGIAATQLATAGTGNGIAALWIASVPTGTTGDVVVTFSQAQSRAGIGVWALYGAAAAAFDTGTSTADPMTDTLNVPASGAAIGYFAGNDNTSATWTNLTENFDEAQESTITQSGASATFAAAQTALAITATPGTAINNHGFVLASFSPQ
jgi:hypothetical protein